MQLELKGRHPAEADQAEESGQEPGCAKLIAEAGGLRALANGSSLNVLFALRGLTAEKVRIDPDALADRCNICRETAETAISNLRRSRLVAGDNWELSRPAEPSPAAEALWQLVDAWGAIPEAKLLLLGSSALNVLVALASLESIAGLMTCAEIKAVSGLSEKCIGQVAVRELMAAGLLRGRMIRGVGLEYTLIPPADEWLPSAIEFYSRRLAKRLKRNKRRDQQVRSESKKAFRNDLQVTESFLGDALPGFSPVAVDAMVKLATGESRRTPDSPAIQELVAAGLVTIRAGQPLLNAPVKDGIARLARSLAGWALARRSAKRLYIALRENSSPGTTREISERSGVHVRWLARSLRELSLLKWIDAEHDGEVWQIKLLDPPPELPAAAMLFYFDPIWQRRQRIEAMIERLEREVGGARGALAGTV